MAIYREGGFTKALAINARRIPERLALRSSSGDRTFKALYQNSCRLAEYFASRGLVDGDRLCIICSNRPEFVEVVLAAELCGVHVTPIVLDSRPYEIEYILLNRGAKAIVVEAAHATYANFVSHMTADCTLKLSVGGDIDGFVQYAAALEPLPTRQSLAGRGVGRLTYFTSGTTGRPKAVIGRRTEAGILARELPAVYAFRRQGDEYLCPIPLANSGVFGLAVGLPLNAGVTVTLLTRLDALEILTTISDHKVTHAYLTPFVLHKIREVGDAIARFDLTSLRLILHGGAPCSADLKQFVLARLGPIAWEFYSSTEGVGTYISPEEWLRKPGSVGKPHPELDLRILNAKRQECEPGEAGYVYCRASQGSGRFSYAGDDEKTASAYFGDHYTTGDIGFLDDEGYLFLVGRHAELVVIGGYNVYPEEVDQVIEMHSAVQASISFGLPSNDGRGERLVSIVSLRNDGAILRPSDIAAWCSNHLASYKRPSEILIVEGVPISVMGKRFRIKAKRIYLDVTSRNGVKAQA